MKVYVLPGYIWKTCLGNSGYGMSGWSARRNRLIMKVVSTVTTNSWTVSGTLPPILSGSICWKISVPFWWNGVTVIRGPVMHTLHRLPLLSLLVIMILSVRTFFIRRNSLMVSWVILFIGYRAYWIITSIPEISLFWILYVIMPAINWISLISIMNKVLRSLFTDGTNG